MSLIKLICDHITTNIHSQVWKNSRVIPRWAIKSIGPLVNSTGQSP